MACADCAYALDMQSTGSGFVDSELTSFSSMLEKLSGCGFDDTPGNTWSQERDQALGARADVAGATYKPRPSPPEPCQSPKARSGKPQTASRRQDTRVAKAIPSKNLMFQAEPWVYESDGVGEIPGEKLTAREGRPELANALRRSVVSIRLNEEEMTLLRQRAVESGISISEYVRSCVVEAEMLRVQVKQVVADMRSQPLAVQGQNALGMQASALELSGPKRKLSGFWSRWAWILLGTRENAPLKLQTTG